MQDRDKNLQEQPGGLYELTKKGREAVMGDGVREVKGSITGHCKDFIFTVREMENTGV